MAGCIGTVAGRDPQLRTCTDRYRLPAAGSTGVNPNAHCFPSHEATMVVVRSGLEVVGGGVVIGAVKVGTSVVVIERPGS